MNSLVFWLSSAFYQVGPDEESMKILEWWIFTMFIKKKGKETQQLEQTQFYVIVFD